MKYNLIILTVVLSSLNFAHAKLQKLVNITQDGTKDVIELSLKLDEDGDVTHIHTVTKNSAGQSLNDIDLYTARSAMSGIVLHKQSGRDIVKLASPNFATHQGGEITLNYLTNGISNSRLNTTFDVSRDGDSWKLARDHRKVGVLHMVTRKIFGKTVGIKKIVPIFKDKLHTITTISQQY